MHYTALYYGHTIDRHRHARHTPRPAAKLVEPQFEHSYRRAFRPGRRGRGRDQGPSVPPLRRHRGDRAEPREFWVARSDPPERNHVRPRQGMCLHPFQYPPLPMHHACIPLWCRIPTPMRSNSNTTRCSMCLGTTRNFERTIHRLIYLSISQVCCVGTLSRSRLFCPCISLV